MWRRSSKTYSFICVNIVSYGKLSERYSSGDVRFCCHFGEYFAKCALQRHMPFVRALKQWEHDAKRMEWDWGKRKHCESVYIWMSWIVLITHWWQNYFEFEARIRNHSHIGMPYICSRGFCVSLYVCVRVYKKQARWHCNISNTIGKIVSFPFCTQKQTHTHTHCRKDVRTRHKIEHRAMLHTIQWFNVQDSARSTYNKLWVTASGACRLSIYSLFPFVWFFFFLFLLLCIRECEMK